MPSLVSRPEGEVKSAHDWTYLLHKFVIIMKLSVAVVAASFAAPSLAMVRPPAALMQRKLLRTELPEVDGQDWKTLENGIEFLPAGDLSPLGEMHMRRLTGDTTYSNVYVDGIETYYDGEWKLRRSIDSSSVCSFLCLNQPVGCHRAA